MKPLLIPVFVLLTASVLAAQSLPLLTDITHTTIRESEATNDSNLNKLGEVLSDSLSAPYVVKKPTETKGMTVPLPLDSPYTAAESQGEAEDEPSLWGPQFPSHRFSLVNVLPAGDLPKDVVRGQMNTVDSLDSYLSAPPPVAEGPIKEGTINANVVGSVPKSLLNGIKAEESFPLDPPKEVKPKTQEAADPLGSNLLLVAVAFTTIGLIYMAFVAYDYRQRWMHSLTAQNDRYLGGGAYDIEIEEVYGSGTVTFS